MHGHVCFVVVVFVLFFVCVFCLVVCFFLFFHVFYFSGNAAELEIILPTSHGVCVNLH